MRCHYIKPAFAVTIISTMAILWNSSVPTPSTDGPAATRSRSGSMQVKDPLAGATPGSGAPERLTTKKIDPTHPTQRNKGVQASSLTSLADKTVSTEVIESPAYKASRVQSTSHSKSRTDRTSIAHLPTNSPEIGIQLAADAPLPAAAMPNSDEKLSPVSTAAAEQISLEFYRQLAARAEETHIEPIVDDSGEATVIIPHGPDAAKARENADATFRAIYGYEAYNRLTMQSTLEAQLPVQPLQEAP
jgi:hypothetical protein